MYNKGVNSKYILFHNESPAHGGSFLVQQLRQFVQNLFRMICYVKCSCS